MALSWSARAPAALLLLVLQLLSQARSVSAQLDACLTYAPTYLETQCYYYLFNPSVPAPDLTCCQEVSFVTSTYGSGCLCEVVMYQQEYPSGSIIPGRMYSLAASCGSNADMSNCNGGGGSSPNVPDIDVPDRPSPPVRPSPVPPSSEHRYKVSRRGVVGGSLGSVAAVGIIAVLVKCFCCSKPDSDAKPVIAPDA